VLVDRDVMGREELRGWGERIMNDEAHSGSVGAGWRLREASSRRKRAFQKGEGKRAHVLGLAERENGRSNDCVVHESPTPHLGSTYSVHLQCILYNDIDQAHQNSAALVYMPADHNTPLLCPPQAIILGRSFTWLHSALKVNSKR
jgi:hypothetical protein